jgi:ribosome-binding factor A
MALERGVRDPRVNTLHHRVSLRRDGAMARCSLLYTGEEVSRGIAWADHARGVCDTLCQVLQWRFAPRLEFRQTALGSTGRAHGCVFRAIEEEQAVKTGDRRGVGGR